jgi:hypothetical protein
VKTIGRILIILLAATLVVGAAWILTRNGANAQFGPGEGRFRPKGGDFNDPGFFPGQPTNGFNPDQRPGGFREGGFERGRRGFFLFGWLRNIGLIAVIVAVILFGESLWKSRRINQAVKPSTDELQTE